MWTRKDLKTIGKAALHRNYWVTVLVTLIYGFQSGHYGKNTLTLFFKRFVQCAVDIAAYCSGNYTGIGYSKEYQLINQGGFPGKEILFAI